MKKAMLIFGTRPEAVKLAPLVEHLRAGSYAEPVVVVTAQHREMLDQVLAFFEIQPDYDLDLITNRQTLTTLTGRLMDGISPVIEKEQPDVVVCQGDTTTTFIAALAAFYHKIPVAHVEAGLRTNDRYSPFPEEVNRRLTGQLASMHLAPTTRARNNLQNEGYRAESVYVTGNTVIDALLLASAKIDPAAAIQRIGCGLEDHSGPVLLVTCHRRESWGAPMRAIAAAVAKVASRFPDVRVVVPLHLNPAVREVVTPVLGELPNVHITRPLPYPDFVWLMERSTVILTDSGGVQEEAPSLGKPVLVTRDTTERPEALLAGTAKLVGTDSAEIERAIDQLLTDRASYEAMARAVNPYGDGVASERCVAAIRHYFGDGPRPADYGASMPVSER